MKNPSNPGDARPAVAAAQDLPPRSRRTTNGAINPVLLDDPLPGPQREGDRYSPLRAWRNAETGINSVAYWDERFLADWVATGGRRQTAFFAGMVLEHLPIDLIDDIAAGDFTIIDVGCALGDALPVLQARFPDARLAGADASVIAIGIARTLFPQFSFCRLDEFAQSPERAGVVYCSNTLEHFPDWRDKLDALGRRASEYVIIAVPFREFDRIPEHVVTFDAETLPTRIGEAAQLVCQIPVRNAADDGSPWPGQQLIAVYAQPDAAYRLVQRGWVAAREAAAATAAIRLADFQRAAAERDAASAAALAAEAAKAQAAAAASEAERAAAAARLREQERLAAGREAALQTAIATHADRLAALARSTAEQQTAADLAVADLLWRLAQRGFAAVEREAALRLGIAELAALLPRPDAAPAGTLRRRLAALGDLRRHRAVRAQRRGVRAFARRDWRGAEAAYRRAVELAPGAAGNWAQLARTLVQHGDDAGAAAAFGRAIALDGTAAGLHRELARALAAAGRAPAAIDAYEAALRIEPHDAARQELDALYSGIIADGDRARDARDWAAAAQRYWRALERSPGLTPIWVQLGNVLKEQGDYAGAESAYRRAVLLDAAVADTHLQLGHLLKLQGRRSLAAKAYATAIRLDPDLQPAHESLHAVLGYSPSDIERFLAAPPPAPGPARSGAEPAALLMPAAFPAAAPPPNGADAARLGPFFAAALRRLATLRDVVWLPVIDWNYRIQRPQHLATQLARAGCRVFYISISFDDEQDAGDFRIVGSPHEAVFEVRLRVRPGPGSNIYAGLSPPVVDDLRCALDAMAAALAIRCPVVVVDHPSWYPVAFAIPGATVVYDCLDLATGFANAADSLAAAERLLIGGADLVVAASAPLASHIAATRTSVLIRNAADVDFFAAGCRDEPARERPVIGYFGAIAEWFEIDWIERCAAARPQWEFRLIGRTGGCEAAGAAALPNVRLLGERPYDELPALLAEFDVAVIPFKMTDLIRCTNPVKLYEYMAAGKPVVSAPLPEVIEATELAYIADNAADFERRIAQALAEDCPELRQRRRAWAARHDWAARARELIAAIEAGRPAVSVIVLTYNNWQLTERCLLSVRSLSDYPNLEIIVVDNASSDATRHRLREMAEHDRRLKLILNEENLGFAAGNNLGLQAARGDYAILLNNDTIVTRGWVRDLIRPMQLDRSIGMVGPLTNRIGNEQRVVISYDDAHDMAEQARRLVRTRLRQTYEVPVLAFFCVALRRAMVEELGFLDEAYGIGFFEDDDYCRRAAQAGWKMVVADDVFVHHHHSGAFAALGKTAAEQMARNRQIFESRWGPWRPHRYRDAPGFKDAPGAAADARPVLPTR